MRSRRTRRTLAVAASACAALAFAPEVLAQGQPLPQKTLLVQRAPAAADCLDSTALAERVNNLAGRAALTAAPSSGEPAFEVQILKSDDGYIAIVLAAGKSRQIADPGPACSSLSEALALMLAILVDADEKPEAPPPPAPVVLPPIEPPRLPPPAPRPLPPRVGPRLLISAGAGIASGLVGDAAPAITLGNDLRVIGPLSLLASVSWIPAQGFALGRGHIDVQLFHGQIGPCLSSWSVLGSTRVGGCLLADVGALHGKAIGYDVTRETARPWAAVSLTGLLDVPVRGPVYWSSRLGLTGVFTQESFAIDKVGVAFSASPVGFFATTGIGLKIL